jgi:hypothetical protein
MPYITRVGIPLSTFALAIALSYLAGAPARGFALRTAQDAPGPGRVLAIEVLLPRVSAINWCHVAPGAGKLLCTGSYAGEINTVDRRMKETLNLKLHVFIQEEDLNPDPKSWSGKQFAPIKSATKHLEGSPTSPESIAYGPDFFSLEANDGADLDAAIAFASQALANALAQAGEQIGPTHGVKTDKTREAAGKGFDARLDIVATGTLADGRPCRALAIREAKVNLDKDGFVVNQPLEERKKE